MKKVVSIIIITIVIPVFQITFAQDKLWTPDSVELAKEKAFDSTVAEQKGYSAKQRLLAKIKLDSINSYWNGKTVWAKCGLISKNYITVKNCAPIKVLVSKTVIPDGIDSLFTPYGLTRFIVQFKNDNGKIDTGAIDIDFFGQQYGVSSYQFSTDVFDDYFYKIDPHVSNKWSKKTWNAIENSKVYVGMTKKQAIMSWGEPDHVNEDAYSEQWVYGDGDYLYFRNGIMTNYQIER
ncbi:MAG TPA: hypothetical protein VFA55_06465 [Candidatus Kapabacteria bacterium]|nr:hypothetical protein [Candidatus Kapabacteria bacterium]